MSLSDCGGLLHEGLEGAPLCGRVRRRAAASGPSGRRTSAAAGRGPTPTVGGTAAAPVGSGWRGIGVCGTRRRSVSTRGAVCGGARRSVAINRGRTTRHDLRLRGPPATSLNIDHNDRSPAANRQAGTFFYFQLDSHTVGTSSELGKGAGQRPCGERDVRLICLSHVR